jgi:endonuclease/exonuclease/phosphatase family metal-dependent hydrolase
MKRWFDRALIASGPLFMTLWLAGWVGNDRHPVLVWLYFIPSFLAAVFGLIWQWTVPPMRWWSPYVKILTGLALIKVFVGDVAWHTRLPPPPGSLRVAHWNIARARQGAQPILERVARDRPDIVLLSEAPMAADFGANASRVLGLSERHQQDGLLLLSRFPIAPFGNLPLTNAHGWSARILTPGVPLDLLAIDLISHPTLARDIPLREVAAWVEEREPAVPLLVMGDFNTMRDASSFQPLRRCLAHAYETAGAGWPYSWPWPVAVYAIDHAWLSANLRAFNYRLHPSFLSDHLRQVFDLQVAPPALPVAMGNAVAP